MEVKPGYKQTEVGVIPEDWEVRRLSDFAELLSSKRIFESDYISTGVPFYRGTEITLLIENQPLPEEYFISEARYEQIQRKYGVPAKGDILITAVGTLGNVYLVPDDRRFYFKDGNLIWLRGVHAIDGKYLAIQLRNRKREIIGNAIGSTQKALTIVMLKETLLLLPPTKAEQGAIAGALSDADALIESLEQLLAKKQQLKQGAMQELLTGKKRLPGFSGEWEVKRLGDVGDITSAGVDKKSRPGELPVRLVNYLDVYRKDFLYSDDLNHWVTAPAHQARRCSVQKGDVFFTPSSETRDDIGIAAVAMEDIPDAGYSYHVVRLRLKEQWDLRFRTYAFKTRAFLGQAETLCDGNGTRYVISQAKFRSMTVQVPPVLEQTAIAEVLSDMDAAIAEIEAKLAKARQLKQGMMQELLTGRIRLV